MKVLILLLLALCTPVWGAEKILMDKEVEVARSDYKEFHFRVPENAAGSVEFEGRFNTMGGLNDDISFYAFDQQNYVNWFSHYKHQKLVNFAKTKQSRFHFVAEPGKTYYIVLDNFFSSVSGKKVKLFVKMIFQK